MTRAALFLAACLAASTAVQPALAAESPFEPGLMRLAEVLGSLHFLRNLSTSASTSASGASRWKS